MKRAADVVREHGGLFVMDEAGTAFGRTGTGFFAFPRHGVAPDAILATAGTLGVTGVSLDLPQLEGKSRSADEFDNLNTHVLSVPQP